MTAQLTEAEFDTKVLGADKPVLVDFFATWCGPCKMMAPVIDEIQTEVAGNAEVYKVDVDQEQGLAQRYGVTSIPTLIVFKNGAIANQMLGVQPKQVLKDALL